MSKSKPKPRGYWKSKENVLAEARQVMEEHGFNSLPSGKKLAELGYSSLEMAIHKYHGGFHRFRKMLGEKQKILEPGLWQDLKYTLDQARQVMEEHGFDSLPNKEKLSKLGYSGLSNAISRHHDGFRKFRKLLGETQKQRELGLWEDLEYTLNQAKQVMEEHGLDSLPAQNKLAELGYSGLAFAIQKYHSGFRKFREILGEEQRKKENGLWQNLDYTLDQAKQVMEEHGLDSLPAQNKLAELGYSSLASAITNYHGGYRKFREILGEEQKQKEPGLWQDLEYTLDQARQVMEEHDLDSLPNSDKLTELGYSSLSAAISKYHGGFPHFRTLLDQELGIPSEREKLEKVLSGYVEE